MIIINVTPSRNLDDNFLAVEDSLSMINDSDLSTTQKEILYRIFTKASHWYLQVVNNIGSISIEYIDVYVGKVSRIYSFFLRQFGITIIDPTESFYAMRKRLHSPIEMGNVYELKKEVASKVLETSYKDINSQLVRFPVYLFDPTRLKKILDDITQSDLQNADHDRAFRITPMGFKKG